MKQGFKICKLILEEGDDKNSVTNLGWTPLHFAANNGHLEVFKFIFEKVTAKYPKTNGECIPQHCQLINTADKNITGMIWTKFKMFWK